jgi:hypothetical protein
MRRRVTGVTGAASGSGKSPGGASSLMGTLSIGGPTGVTTVVVAGLPDGAGSTAKTVIDRPGSMKRPRPSRSRSLQRQGEPAGLYGRIQVRACASRTPMPEAHLIAPRGRVRSPISPGQDRCLSVPVLDSRIWAMRCLPLTRLRPTTSTLRFSVMVLRVSAKAGRVS